jgi:hypothetical protein
MRFRVAQTTAFPTTHDSALGCILIFLAGNLYDIYMNYHDLTELWDSLEHKYDVSKDDCLLHICGQLFDYTSSRVSAFGSSDCKFGLPFT